MPSWGEPSVSRFSATFPKRFAAALAEAQGTIAGIAASAESHGGALIDPRTLQRLHEIYRLRVELEIETAGVLWRTAEVVSALSDALEVLGRRRPSLPSGAASWLSGLARGEVEARRVGTLTGEAAERRRASWPNFGGQAPAPEPQPASWASPPAAAPQPEAWAPAPPSPYELGRRRPELPGERYGGARAA